MISLVKDQIHFPHNIFVHINCGDKLRVPLLTWAVNGACPDKFNKLNVLMD